MSVKIKKKYVSVILLLIMLLALLIVCLYDNQYRMLSFDVDIVTNQVNEITEGLQTVRFDKNCKKYSDTYMYPFDFFMLDFKLTYTRGNTHKEYVLESQKIDEKWGIDVEYTITDSSGNKRDGIYPSSDAYDMTVDTEFFIKLERVAGVHNLKISIPSIKFGKTKIKESVFNLNFNLVEDDREDVGITLKAKSKNQDEVIKYERANENEYDLYIANAHDGFDIHVIDYETNETLAYKGSDNSSTYGQGVINAVNWRCDKRYNIGYGYKLDLDSSDKDLYLLRISYYGCNTYRTKVYYCYVLLK